MSYSKEQCDNSLSCRAVHAYNCSTQRETKVHVHYGYTLRSIQQNKIKIEFESK